MARIFMALALMLAAALPAASARAQSFNAQEQAEIRALVRDYLVRNPDVLREALDALEERRMSELWRQVSADPRDFSLGRADAPIVIVEFFDYRCPYCHSALEWLSDIARSRRDVRIVFKELPILTDASMEAARAQIAAMPQGRYWRFHQALMGFTGDLTSERIDQLARSAGIDVPRMRRAMDDPAVNEILQDNRARAVDLGLTGTPGFMINGEVIPSYNRPLLEQRLRELTRETRQAQR